MKDIKRAISILEDNISTINSVSEWSDMLGYNSDKYFSRRFRNYFGERPKDVMVRIKIQKIKEFLSISPNEIFYCVAKETGFADDQALYKFVIRHTGVSPSALKRRVRKEGEKGG